MFGYKSDHKFLFSPLGNLFLKHYKNLDEQKYIFTTMLWSMQFPHPEQSSNQNNINIYPFRLILKLLTEEKLKRKLYPEEILYFIYFFREIDENGYHTLIRDILNFRKLSDLDKKQKMLDEDLYSQHNFEMEWIPRILMLFLLKKPGGQIKLMSWNILKKLKQLNYTK